MARPKRTDTGSSDNAHLEAIARLLRLLVLESTTKAGSGHPTSCLSAIEIVTALFFGGSLRADLRKPDNPSNDRFVLSKGHAAPLLYALYAVAGAVPVKALSGLRTLDSPLEGHPVMRFRYTEAPTGSLGQGLSIGLGEAIAATIDRKAYRTYVLLGDGEVAEGSVWEAIQYAGHRKTGNLTGIVDMNRLGQSGPTMLEHDASRLAWRIRSFDWKTVIVDGHSIPALLRAFRDASAVRHMPTMIIAKTFKGRGVPLLENKEGWHGKPLAGEELSRAITALGPVDRSVRGVIALPKDIPRKKVIPTALKSVPGVRQGTASPREAVAQALVRYRNVFPRMVVLDADVKNSTFVERFAVRVPGRFVETYIAEQNMAGIMVGLAARGWLPVAATFASFWTRAHDQLRMAQYSGMHMVCLGTHAGVHIGQDGPSQMGLEDIALFRSLSGSIVLYPCDAVSADQLTVLALKSPGIAYVRATRAVLPAVYASNAKFTIGGSRTLRHSTHDTVTVVSAGITVHESLKAASVLQRRGVHVRVIDCYSIKPIDADTLQRAARETGHILVVEDHYQEGGIADAVRSALGRHAGTVHALAVRKIPRSAAPEELLAYAHIDAKSVVDVVLRLVRRRRT